MKIHTQFQQNSTEWLVAKSGKVTASELDALISPTWKVRTGDGVKTYLHKKLAEVWIGGNLPSLNGIFDMEIGKILEEEAKPFYTALTGEKITDAAFIETDDGRCGCSPDGLIGEDCGIEIKCPRMETHIGYLLEGELPKDYHAQVYGSMYFSERPRWKFMSYRRNFPPFIIEVKRDEEIMSAIGSALERFYEVFDDAMESLIKTNGGPPNPKRRGLAPFPKRFIQSSNENDYLAGA